MSVVHFRDIGARAEKDEPRAPGFSDEALALRFPERHAHELRYVAAWSRWMVWDGVKWGVDETLAAFDKARRICREAAAECDQPKVAPAIASSKTVAAVERLARADRRLAATIGQWTSIPGASIRQPASVIYGPVRLDCTGKTTIARKSRRSAQMANALCSSTS